MRRLLISAVLGAALLSGGSACGVLRSGGDPADAGSAAGAAIEEAASFTPEGEALAAMGFDPQQIAAAEPGFALAAAEPQPSASPSTKPGKRLADWRKRKALRVMLTRNTLHGEAVVQKKDGTTVTIAVQRGVITALTETSVTVKSADGYTLTWTLGDGLRVVEKRRSVQPSAVKVGQEVGIAGAKEGDASIARFILIPLEK
ncbi:MAG: hypothetical protein HOV79_19575 [Hamadaea sp.]|nr:hypothetical protein [Hamadaea sp.]